jgi:hypothetical protein
MRHLLKVFNSSSFLHGVTTSMNWSRAIAEAVSRRIPTAAARVRAQVGSCGICGGQSGTRAGFLRELRFRRHNSHSINCSTITSINHPGLVQLASSGRRTKWNQESPHSQKLKEKKKLSAATHSKGSEMQF